MWFPKLTWGLGKHSALSRSITTSFHTLFNEFFNPPWSSYTQVYHTLLQQFYLLLDLFQNGREQRKEESLESSIIVQFRAFNLKVKKVKKQKGLLLFRVNFQGKEG